MAKDKPLPHDHDPTAVESLEIVLKERKLHKAAVATHLRRLVRVCKASLLEQALSQENIQAGFAKTGIYPYRSENILGCARGVKLTVAQGQAARKAVVTLTAKARCDHEHCHKTPHYAV